MADSQNTLPPYNSRLTRKAPPKRTNPHLRKVGIGAGVLVLVALGAWGAHYQAVGQYLEETNDAYVQADTVTISPKVSGYIEEVRVGNNQDVKKGDVLITIDSRDYRARSAQAKAQVDVAAATLEGMAAQLAEQHETIAQARAQLAAAQEAADFAKSQEERYAPLARNGAETKEQLAAKRSQARQSLQDVEARRAALALAERRMTSLDAQIKQAQAQGETAAAQLAQSNINLESTQVFTSIDGRVGDLTARVGQFVQAGTRLMSVVPLHQLYVTANFKETQVGRMRVGQTATLKIDALPDVDIKGHIVSISPGTGAEFSLIPPQNATGNFTKIVQRVPVRIALDVDDRVRKSLVTGLSTTVEVDTRSPGGPAQRQAVSNSAEERQ
jgi:membrane fusion protein, multidrug efflux system